MKNVTPVRRAFVAAAVAGIVALGMPVAAQTPAAFYQGKTVTIIVGVPPGGSYHMYAALAANHLKRHIPGNPNVIIEHRPGGGGVRAARHFYSNGQHQASVGRFPLARYSVACDAQSRSLMPAPGQRYDKLTGNYLAFIRFASIRLWLRVRESTPSARGSFLCCCNRLVFLGRYA